MNIGAYQAGRRVSIELPTLAAVEHLASRLAGQPGPNVWLLSGPLGSGKTTFTRALLRALGLTGRVVSPTFVLQKIYRSRRGWTRVVHIDAYRLRHPREIESLAIEESLGEPNTLLIIEWPERLDRRWGIPVRRFRFAHAGTGRRLTMSIPKLPAPKLRLRRRGHQRPSRSHSSQ